jgi:phage terminase large subunit-like protein
MGRPRKLAVATDEGSERAFRFINLLKHTKGKFAHEPFNLRPWQEHDIIRPLFSTDPKTGLRRYRTSLLMLPRKNGKSEIAAAIALYGLLADNEAGAEVYSAAADRDQASLVFNVAAQMVRAEPKLDAICDIIDSQKRIVHRKSGSFYRAISSEAYTKHGFNASMIIADELHAWPNRELWDVLTTSQGARSQPLAFAISTAGYDRHSILWELYSHAKNVKENPEIDPTFLPIIYEMDKDADWTDEREWHKCNPALGDFRSLEEMRVMAARAKAIPAQENTFRRLYGNQWTEQAERWIPMPLWDACGEDIDWTDFRGRRCFVGMDLSSTRDLTALVAVFPDDDGGFDVLPLFFVPADNIRERENRDRVPYGQWVKDGKIIQTPGNVVDYASVRAAIHEWAERFEIVEIAYDSWNAHDLIPRLVADGFKCERVGQGIAAQTSATKLLEKAIVSKTMRHDRHPVLRWNIGNAAVEQDHAGNLVVSKKVSTEKIDGVRAMTNGVERMRQVVDVPSAYATERQVWF